MKTIVCLAITFGLIGLLFLYIRQKMGVYELRLNTLTDVVQTLAQELATPLHNEIEPDLDSDSDDSTDSEESTDSECEDIEIKVKVIELEKPIEQVTIELDEKIKVMDETIEVMDEKIEVSDEETVKTIKIELNPYESLSVKELKEKVAEMGGPVLKTKKALLEYIEKKM